MLCGCRATEAGRQHRIPLEVESQKVVSHHHRLQPHPSTTALPTQDPRLSQLERGSLDPPSFCLVVSKYSQQLPTQVASVQPPGASEQLQDQGLGLRAGTFSQITENFKLAVGFRCHTLQNIREREAPCLVTASMPTTNNQPTLGTENPLATHRVLFGHQAELWLFFFLTKPEVLGVVG